MVVEQAHDVQLVEIMRFGIVWWDNGCCGPQLKERCTCQVLGKEFCCVFSGCKYKDCLCILLFEK